MISFCSIWLLSKKSKKKSRKLRVSKRLQVVLLTAERGLFGHLEGLNIVIIQLCVEFRLIFHISSSKVFEKIL